MPFPHRFIVVLAAGIIAVAMPVSLWTLPVKAGEKSADSASQNEPPEVAQFEQAYEAFRQYRLDLLVKLRDVMSKNPQQRGELLREASIQSDTLMSATIDAAEAAINASPENQKVRRFLLLIAKKSYEADRFELSGRLAVLLLDHHSTNTALYRVAGHSFLETGDIDRAQKYLQAAQQANNLDVYGRAYLKKIEDFREMYKFEKMFRRQDAERGDLPRVVLKTTRGDVLVELFEDQEPNTVAAFVKLVDDGFYDSLPFFRVMPGFGAITGSPNGDGSGGPDFRILSEAAKSRGHFRGSLSMITDRDGTTGSQFLIPFRLTATVRLNGKYTVFGRIIEGMDVILRLNRTNPELENSAVKPDRIIEARVVRRRHHAYQPITVRMQADRLLAEARKLLSSGKTDEAIQRLHTVLQLDNTNQKANLTIGFLYSQKKGEESANRALYFLGKAVSLNPKDTKARFAFGVALLQKSKFVQAAEQFQAVVARDPKHFQALNYLGIAYSQHGNLKEAVQYFEQALAVKPGYKPALNNLERVQARLRADKARGR